MPGPSPPRHSLTGKAFPGEPFRGSCSLTRPFNCEDPFHVSALVKQREAAESTQTAAFRSLLSAPLCFAAQPCLHKCCWKLTPPEFQKFGEQKNVTNQRCFSCHFLVPGVVLTAGMGFTNPTLQCQYQETGKVTPVLSEKEEGGM